MHLEISLEQRQRLNWDARRCGVANKTSWQITHKWPESGGSWLVMVAACDLQPWAAPKTGQTFRAGKCVADKGTNNIRFHKMLPNAKCVHGAHNNS